MTKPEFIGKVAEAAGCTKKIANEVATAIFNVINEQLVAGEAITWPQFGTFKTVLREQREVRNLITKQMMTLPAHRVVKFKASEMLKASVKGQ